MFGAYTVQQIRDAEAAAMAGRPELELMLRAATGLAVATGRELRRVRGRVSGAHLLVLAGAGNNGGDALFAAAVLARRGVGVRAWRVFERAHEAAWREFVRSGGREVSAAEALELLPWADLVLDGVFGIGGRPGLPRPVAEFGDRCAQAGVPVVAVDLPSGLDADTGTAPVPETRPRIVTVQSREPSGVSEPEPATVPHLTSTLCVTFGARKLCHVLRPGVAACGRVEVVDIGLDLPAPALTCWEPADVAAAWPVPGPRSDKYSRGVVGIDAGSATYPGAGVLATLGAVWSGAGMVRFLGRDPVEQGLAKAIGELTKPGGPGQVAASVGEVAPNVVFQSGRVQALVLGPGWGVRPDGLTVVQRALSEPGLKVLIDADGLGYLPPERVTGEVVLTPHAGELAQLLAIKRTVVEDDPIGTARAAAARFGAVVLLKGSVQVVAEPDGRVQIAVPGPAWTAQAGSGDVLAGVIGTLLAAGLPPATAAACGASLQALAAAANPGPFPPHELAHRFPDVIAKLTATR